MRTYYQGFIAPHQTPSVPTTIQAPDIGDHYRRSDIKSLLRAFTGMGFANAESGRFESNPVSVKF